MDKYYHRVVQFWESDRWGWDHTTHFYVGIEEGYFECVEPEVNAWEPVPFGQIVVKPVLKCWGKGVTKHANQKIKWVGCK